MDWFLPPTCAGCRQDGSWWCDFCYQSVKPLTITYQVPALAGVKAAAYYGGPIRNGLRSLKYQHAKAVAPFLAAYLQIPLRQIGSQKLVLIPVPLHRRRLKSRGHNQARLLAHHLGKLTGLPVQDQLTRIRPTVSQTTLDKPHRAANVAGAFAWRGESLSGQTAVIIDDVTTTGATLSACATALKPAHPASVWGLTVAKKR